MIFEDGIHIVVNGGYIEGDKYHFHSQDHLGNNVMVLDQNGVIEQREYYYPFGASFPELTWDGNNAYKYNGKELDKMHGLNLYDYSARHYDPAIGRFTSVDPSAEKYYTISPYVYVGNNPLKRTDPDGKDWRDVLVGIAHATADNISMGLIIKEELPIILIQIIIMLDKILETY